MAGHPQLSGKTRASGSPQVTAGARGQTPSKTSLSITPMTNLRELARRAMIDRGFLVDIPRDAQAEVATTTEPAFDALGMRDLSSWFWSSIDNDESRDLDQIEYSKKEASGTTLYVGVADVDWFVNRS